MNVVRPIKAQDLDVLSQIAEDSGPGFTSLPHNTKILVEKIARSEHAFDSDLKAGEEASYLFVMEDLKQKKVIGTCGIEAAVGMSSPWYHYRMGTRVHHSRELNVRTELKTLYLCNDYTGHSEICTLYLQPEYRNSGNGALLSKSRFLFMSEFADRFANNVIAEMRGVSNAAGSPPFWEGLGKQFFSIEFSEADYLTGMGNKSFIAELMPNHPIYVHMLPTAAQNVIGKVHKNTEPARKMLEDEGFRFEGYIDIFDGGPTLLAHLEDIKTVYANIRRRVVIDANASPFFKAMVCNNKLKDFRAMTTVLDLSTETVVKLTPAQASALKVKDGDKVRILRLN